jgi:hypothetical protein
MSERSERIRQHGRLFVGGSSAARGAGGHRGLVTRDQGERVCEKEEHR